METLFFRKVHACVLPIGKYVQPVLFFPVLVSSLPSAPAHTSGVAAHCACCDRKSHSALIHTCRTGAGRKARSRSITGSDSPCPLRGIRVCTADEPKNESASYRSVFRLLRDLFFARGAHAHQEHWTPRTGEVMNMKKEPDNCQYSHRLSNLWYS